MECVLHLEKTVNRSLLELDKLATDRNDPPLCYFIGTPYLNEQMKSFKELGDHATYLCKTGVPRPPSLAWQSVSLTNTSWETVMMRAKP